MFEVRDNGADATLSRRFAIGDRIVTFIGDHRPLRNVGPDIEQRPEIPAVAGLAAGEIKTDGMTYLVCF